MEKKDYIKEFIESNMPLFNEEEPDAGHFERFGEKLKKSENRRKLGFAIIWKVAAAAVFVFLAVNQALIWFSPRSGQGESMAGFSAGFEEATFYYTSAIHNGLAQWDQLVEKGIVAEEEKRMMQDELKEFEQIHRNLSEELKTNPNDERVINAMLEYYQAKLSIINLVVEKLKEVKSINNQNHEIKM